MKLIDGRALVTSDEVGHPPCFHGGDGAAAPRARRAWGSTRRTKRNAHDHLHYVLFRIPRREPLGARASHPFLALRLSMRAARRHSLVRPSRPFRAGTRAPFRPDQAKVQVAIFVGERKATSHMRDEP